MYSILDTCLVRVENLHESKDYAWKNQSWSTIYMEILIDFKTAINFSVSNLKYKNSQNFKGISTHSIQ